MQSPYFQVMNRMMLNFDLQEEFYEIKHVLQALHVFMMKSTSNPCFLSILWTYAFLLKFR